jgi:hypothetical protein
VKRLTILVLLVDNDVALDHKILQTWSSGEEKLDQTQGADTRWPEPLKRLGILAPRIDDDLKNRAPLNNNRF